MDIPFEKVSVKEAKAALDQLGATLPARADKNWASLRNTQEPVRLNMTQEAVTWLIQLPVDVRPKMLAAVYPRIFNKIVDLWSRPLLLEKYLDELLMDNRGTRKGFPSAVGGELTTLKTYFNSVAKIRHFDVWGERIGD